MTAAPRRGRGLKPVPSHKRHLLGAPHVVGSAAPYTLPIDRRDHLHPTRVNQGRSSSCPGGGSCQLVYASLSLAGTPLPWLPSPRGIYADVRAFEQPGNGPLEDNGADPTDLIQTLQTYGVRKMDPERTPDGRPYDLSTPADLVGIPGAVANVDLRSTAVEDEQSSRDLVVGVQLLDQTATDFEAKVAGALAEGMTVGIGLDATNLFEALGDAHHDDAMPALEDASGATPEDGHWTGCYAVRQGPAGHEFFILSSWGAEWGCNGGIWITANWLRQRTSVALKFQCAVRTAA